VFANFDVCPLNNTHNRCFNIETLNLESLDALYVKTYLVSHGPTHELAYTILEPQAVVKRGMRGSTISSIGAGAEIRHQSPPFSQHMVSLVSSE